jgi:hypothetical protein
VGDGAKSWPQRNVQHVGLWRNMRESKKIGSMEAYITNDATSCWIPDGYSTSEIMLKSMGLGVNGSSILNCVLKQYGVTIWIGLNWLRINSICCLCEHSGPSSSLRAGNSLTSWKRDCSFSELVTWNTSRFNGKRAREGSIRYQCSCDRCCLFLLRLYRKGVAYSHNMDYREK